MRLYTETHDGHLETRKIEGYTHDGEVQSGGGIILRWYADEETMVVCDHTETVTAYRGSAETGEDVLDMRYNQEPVVMVLPSVVQEISLTPSLLDRLEAVDAPLIWTEDRIVTPDDLNEAQAERLKALNKELIPA